MTEQKRHRPKVPDSVALQAALIHGQVLCGCGCGVPIKPAEMEREHDPALQNREYGLKDGKWCYTPDANDPRYLKLWRRECHDKKTHGKGGERRITTKGSDNHTGRRTKNLKVAHEKFQAKMRAKAGQTGDET